MAETVTEVPDIGRRGDPGHPRADDATGRGGAPLTDAELTELALSGEPLADPDQGAVPMDVFLATSSGPLPAWYMPATATRVGARWRVPVVGTIVFAFLLIEILGLCNTFGQLQLP